MSRRKDLKKKSDRVKEMGGREARVVLSVRTRFDQEINKIRA